MLLGSSAEVIPQLKHTDGTTFAAKSCLDNQELNDFAIVMFHEDAVEQGDGLYQFGGVTPGEFWKH